MEWINDSSLTVRFESDEKALASFRNVVLDKETVKENQQGINLLELREAFCYTGRLKFECKLQVRFATELDTKSEQTKAEQSRFYKMVQEKKDKALKRQVGQEKFEKLKASYAIKKEEKNLRNII